MKLIERFCFQLSRMVLLSLLKNGFAFTSQERFCFHLSVMEMFVGERESIIEKGSITIRTLFALTFLDFLMGEDRKL